jgi:hypothetical protein
MDTSDSSPVADRMRAAVRELLDGLELDSHASLPAAVAEAISVLTIEDLGLRAVRVLLARQRYEHEVGRLARRSGNAPLANRSARKQRGPASATRARRPGSSSQYSCDPSS